MILVVPAFLGLALGLLVGGRVERLALLRFRRIELFFVAFAVQIVAFPFPWLPWTTNGSLATVLWLVSFALVAAGAWYNRHIVGVPLVAAGLASNVLAVGANGGHMPALPSALAAANENYVVSNNSERVASPNLWWLVDRWAVPDWLPVGNVYSIGDAVIAVGIVLVVVVAMGTGVPRLRSTALVDERQVVGQ
jgi:hypothetical protein